MTFLSAVLATVSTAQEDLPGLVASVLRTSEPSEEIAPAAPYVGVFPFEFTTRRESTKRFSLAGDTVANMVATGLADSGFRVAEGAGFARLLGQANRPVEAYRAALAADFGALAGLTHVVVGELEQRGRRIHASLRLVDLTVDDPAGQQIAFYEQELGGAKAWERRFGGQKLAKAVHTSSSIRWGAGGVLPNPERELEVLGGLFADDLAARYGAALSGKRVAVVATDEEGVQSKLGEDLAVLIRESLGNAGVSASGDVDVLRTTLQQIANRSLWHWNRWMLTQDTAEAASWLRLAKLDGVVWVTIRDRKNGDFTIEPRILAAKDELPLDVTAAPSRTLGHARWFSKHLVARSRTERTPISTFTPDARSELFAALHRAAVALSTGPDARIPKGATVGLGVVSLDRQSRSSTVIEAFGKRVAQWREMREAEFADLEPVEKRKAVFDGDANLEFGGQVFRSLRQAQGAVAQMEMDLFKSGAEADLGDIRSRLRDSLALFDVHFAPSESELVSVIDYHKAVGDLAALLDEPMPLPKWTGPRYIVNASIRDEGKTRGAVLSAKLIDMWSGKPSKPVNITMWPECREGVMQIVRSDGQEVGVPEPDPRLLTGDGKREVTAPGSASSIDGVGNLEHFLEQRVGSVVLSWKLPSGKFRLHRAGTCFGLTLPSGDKVLVTNRHVVTDTEGGAYVLATGTEWARRQGVTFRVYFPKSDGTTESFETRVLGWSPNADLALLEDRRAVKACFETAPAAEMQLADPLLIVGYPGFANEYRGLNNDVVEGKNGKSLVVLTNDPRDAQGMIDVYVTRGCLTSFSRSVRGRSIGREITTDATAFHGNSGGPIFSMDLRVMGILTNGMADSKSGNSITSGPLCEEHTPELQRLLDASRR